MLLFSDGTSFGGYNDVRFSVSQVYMSFKESPAAFEVSYTIVPDLSRPSSLGSLV